LTGMFCGNCGAKVEGGFVYCPSCGSKMTQVQEQTHQTVPPQSFGDALLPGSLGQAVRLSPGENVVKIYKARKLDPHGGDPEDDDSRTGILLLTDHRLVFIEESGVLHKKLSASETVPMSEINLVNVTGLLSKSLTVSYIRYKLTYKMAFDQFREVDLMTMKGTQSVAPLQAQQVFADAIARNRRNMSS
jgi:hypothetical protein